MTFRIKTKLKSGNDRTFNTNTAHAAVLFGPSRGEMIQGWDGGYEGCQPAQVAAVSNAPPMWGHQRGSWWPEGIATWADGLLHDESFKRSLDLWEQGTRVLIAS
jgi:hypothetical protein